MNSIDTILSMIETKAIDDGLKSVSNISRTAHGDEGEVMKSEFETWLYVNTSMNHLYIRGESQDENGAYHNESIQILWTAWQHQQSKVDELTKQRDSFIKAYEIEMNKSVELQADWESLKDKNNVHQLMLRGVIATPDMQQCLHLHGEDALKRWDGIDELQNRVDAVKQLIDDYKDPSITSDKVFQHGLLLVAMELEQALKGGGE